MFPSRYGVRNLGNFQEQTSKTIQLSFAGIPHQNEKSNQTWSADSSPSVEVKCRSLKEKVEAIEISFEADFLHQHLNSLKTSLQKYIESSIKQSQENKLTIMSTNLYQPQTNTTSENSKISLNLALKSLLTKKQQIQYSTDLEPEEKLTDFLSDMSALVPKEVYDELVYISFFVWEMYVEVRKPLLKTKDIANFANIFTQKHHESLFLAKKIQYLNLFKAHSSLSLQKKKHKEAFKTFIKQFSETIFLVIQQYFENPYYENDEAKRERDEDVENLQFDEDDENIMFPETEGEESSQLRRFPSKYRKIY